MYKASEGELKVIQHFVNDGYKVVRVCFVDDNYTDSHVLLRHWETGVSVKVLIDNCFFEDWVTEFLVQQVTPQEVEDTSDYYQLKLSLGDD
jgi:hypothetical protein